MSSSSGTNNSTRYRRQPGQIYAVYAPNNYEHNNLFPGLPNFGANPSARSAADHWLTSRTPATLHSPARILVNNVLARDMNSSSRQLMPESPPRSIPTDDESRLTKDEQKTVLEKMKKEIYNPTPKKIIQRLSLYYRDNARNSSTEKNKEGDEDDKNCAICLEDFEPRQVVMLTPCSHMFHEECIVPWVKCHGQCPVCRFAICDRIRAGAVLATNNNQANVTDNDPIAGELMAVMRAMEEAVAWRNVRGAALNW